MRGYVSNKAHCPYPGMVLLIRFCEWFISYSTWLSDLFCYEYFQCYKSWNISMSWSLAAGAFNTTYNRVGQF